jgi:2-polyprenyl-6-methoxyphenol hydroxylase-like FAD-dependent oxidoreductase
LECAHHAQRLHVIVVDGGLGGLCLAQGLTRSGISVSVHERDTSARSRGQGYRITLKEAGIGALRACLPEHLYELCVATSIRTATRMVFMDHRLRPKFERPVPPDAGGGFGVHRLTLREILLAGLDGVVRFGSTFERLERLDSGRVRAWFAGARARTATWSSGRTGPAPRCGPSSLRTP